MPCTEIGQDETDRKAAVSRLHEEGRLVAVGEEDFVGRVLFAPVGLNLAKDELFNLGEVTPFSGHRDVCRVRLTPAAQLRRLLFTESIPLKPSAAAAC